MNQRYLRKTFIVCLEILVPVFAIATWYIISSDSKSIYFPPLRDIFISFYNVWFGDGFIQNALPSLKRLAVGYMIASLLGITIGVSVGLSQWITQLCWPIIEFLRALPSVILIPFGIVVFGVDDGMKIFVISLGCSFPIILNTVDGVRGVERIIIDVSRTFQFGPLERVFRVVLPAASPQIFAGLRTAISLALILMVVSEMIASTNGIGYSILQDQRLFATDQVWAGIIFLGVLGYMANLLIVLLEHWLLQWHRGFRAMLLEV